MIRLARAGGWLAVQEIDAMSCSALSAPANQSPSRATTVSRCHSLLPAGASSEPFDIAATDGTVIDLDTPGGNSNPFVTVPANSSGHTHVALTRSS
jgi:hypothetical protein